MFTQKRPFYKRSSFYIVIVAVVICIGGFVIFQLLSKPTAIDPSTTNSGAMIEQEDTDNNQVTEDDADEYPSNTDDTSEANKASNGLEAQLKTIDKARLPYYLIQKVNNSIDVYYINSEGDAALNRHTDISFDMLTEQDQAIFRDGIIVENEQELMTLLQDFES